MLSTSYLLFDHCGVNGYVSNLLFVINFISKNDIVKNLV